MESLPAEIKLLILESCVFKNRFNDMINLAHSCHGFYSVYHSHAYALYNIHLRKIEGYSQACFLAALVLALLPTAGKSVTEEQLMNAVKLVQERRENVPIERCKHALDYYRKIYDLSWVWPTKDYCFANDIEHRRTELFLAVFTILLGHGEALNTTPAQVYDVLEDSPALRKIFPNVYVPKYGVFHHSAAVASFRKRTERLLTRAIAEVNYQFVHELPYTGRFGIGWLFRSPRITTIGCHIKPGNAGPVYKWGQRDITYELVYGPHSDWRWTLSFIYTQQEGGRELRGMAKWRIWFLLERNSERFLKAGIIEAVEGTEGAKFVSRTEVSRTI